LSIKFNTTTGEFRASFTVDTSINAPTVIYTSDEYYYPNEYTMIVLNTVGQEINDSDVVIKQVKHNYIGFQIVNSKYDNETVQVVIIPKASKFELLE
jgi:hypothetical protein